MNDCPRQNPAYRPAPTEFRRVLRRPDRVEGYPCPEFAGPAGCLQSGTRLIGTAPVGLLPKRLSIFIPENRPGRNPSIICKTDKDSPPPCPAAGQPVIQLGNNAGGFLFSPARRTGGDLLTVEAPSGQVARGLLAWMANRGFPVHGCTVKPAP